MRLPRLHSIAVHHPLAVPDLLCAVSVQSTLTSLSVTVSTREHILAVNWFYNLCTLVIICSGPSSSWELGVARSLGIRNAVCIAASNPLSESSRGDETTQI